MKFTAIIVDDEENSRLLLKDRLGKWHPGIQVVDSCEHPRDALLSIVKHKPDLLFLDIRMPDMDGLEFFRCISDLKVRVQCIIISAHTEPAYFREAIRLGLADYLVKPILKEELDNAIANSVKRLQKLGNQLIQAPSPLPEQKVALTTATGAIYASYDHVLYVKAAGKYAELYTLFEKEVVMHGISELEELFKDTGIERIDRFTLINRKYIQKISLQFSRVTLFTGKEHINLDVSKKGAEHVFELMKTGR